MESARVQIIPPDRRLQKAADLQRRNQPHGRAADPGDDHQRRLRPWRSVRAEFVERGGVDVSGRDCRLPRRGHLCPAHSRRLLHPAVRACAVRLRREQLAGADGVDLRSGDGGRGPGCTRRHEPSPRDQRHRHGAVDLFRQYGHSVAAHQDRARVRRHFAPWHSAAGRGQSVDCHPHSHSAGHHLDSLVHGSVASIRQRQPSDGSAAVHHGGRVATGDLRTDRLCGDEKGQLLCRLCRRRQIQRGRLRADLPWRGVFRVRHVLHQLRSGDSQVGGRGLMDVLPAHGAPDRRATQNHSGVLPPVWQDFAQAAPATGVGLTPLGRQKRTPRRPFFHAAKTGGRQCPQGRSSSS